MPRIWPRLLATADVMREVALEGEKMVILCTGSRR
jgi:hypothetical protein